MKRGVKYVLILNLVFCGDQVAGFIGHSLRIKCSRATGFYPQAFSPTLCRSMLLETNEENGEPSESTSLLNKDDEEMSPLLSQQIWSLALPAFVSEVMDPLLGLVDTAFVGHFTPGDKSAALAGVGSATALLNFSFFLMNFLTTATTPLVSQRRAAKDTDAAKAVASQSLSLAIVLGLTMTTILILLSVPLLTTVMGTRNTGPEANAYALSFLCIRALAAPAVFTISASTGVLRGFMDTKTPVGVLLTANTLNCVLDTTFIVGLKLGPTGAAMATTTTEWISALTLLAVLKGDIPNRFNSDAPPPIGVTPSLHLPPLEEIKPLLVASGSLFLRSASLQTFLVGAAAMAARGDFSATNAANVAAHQVALQIWLLCSFVCDALAAASQVLVSDAIGRKDLNVLHTVTRLVCQYGIILGAVLAVLLHFGFESNLLYELFVPPNTPTAAALSSLVPILVLSQPLNAVVFTLDGVLQGASQFPYQAKTMVLSVSAGVAAFLLLENLETSSTPLVHVWEAFAVLQSVRLITSLWKMSQEPINIFSSRE